MPIFAVDEGLSRQNSETIAVLPREVAGFASHREAPPAELRGGAVAMPAGAGPSSGTRLEMQPSARCERTNGRQLMLLARLIGITPRLTREMRPPKARPQQIGDPGRARECGS
jgi:hypothetical protein